MKIEANIRVRCLLCWTRFVTSAEALEEKTAECPKCQSTAVTDGKDDDDG